MPTCGDHWGVIILGEVADAEGEEGETEKKKRDVPNYLERTPSYFDEGKGERLTRNKTMGATSGVLGTQSGEIRAP